MIFQRNSFPFLNLTIPLVTDQWKSRHYIHIRQDAEVLEIILRTLLKEGVGDFKEGFEKLYNKGKKIEDEGIYREIILVKDIDLSLSHREKEKTPNYCWISIGSPKTYQKTPEIVKLKNLGENK